jgi:hypothetical protein
LMMAPSSGASSMISNMVFPFSCLGFRYQRSGIRYQLANASR